VAAAIVEWHGEHGWVPRSYEWAPNAGRALGLIGPDATRWELEHPRWPERSTVQRHFGSWREAIIAAGFPSPPPLVGTLGERVEAAKRLAHAGESLGSIADYLGVHLNTARKYVRATRCDGCGEPKVTPEASVCRVCVLEARNEPAFSRRQLIEALRAWAGETGEIPSSYEWTDSKGGSRKWRREWPRWPSARQVCRVLGCWSSALEQANLPGQYRTFAIDELRG
jgi:hypothetical protein